MQKQFSERFTEMTASPKAGTETKEELAKRFGVSVENVSIGRTELTDSEKAENAQMETALKVVKPVSSAMVCGIRI